MKFPADRKVMKKSLKVKHKWPPKKPVEPDADDIPVKKAKKKVVKKKAIKKKGAIKTTGSFHGKPNRLGGGGRFAQVAAQAGGGARGAAIAAAAGRAKYGNNRMAQMSAAGRKKTLNMKHSKAKK